MAKMVLTSTYLGLNSVDRSDNVSRVELTVDVESKDVTVFASDGWKEVLGGIKSAGLAIMFKNDMADNALDETMWALLGTVVTFEVRPTDAVVGPSNAKYTGSVLINGWTPISGATGDVNEFTVTYPTSGAVSRGVA